MTEIWGIIGYPVVFSIGAYFVYAIWLKPNMTSAAAALGKAETVAASTGVSKFWAILDGWKTTILAFIAGLVQLPGLMFQYVDADVVKEWQSLPWASVLDAKVANYISLGCAFLIPILHTMGIKNAANTVPKA